MAPKLPGKFDDISKAASGVLGDDFQTSGYQLKAKQGTNFLGASSDLTVDYAEKGDVKTPTKLSFKIPKPGLDGFSVDKLEMDKSGSTKLETSLSKALHKVDGLKIEVKTNLADAVQNLAYAATFTGIADTSLKFETAQKDPAKFSLEVLRGVGPAVVGAQLKEGAANPCPSVGVNYTHGDLFASCFAKNKFTEFTLHGLYNASKDLKVAATYQVGGKKNGSYGVGASTSLAKDLSAKAKFQDGTVSVTVKKELAPKTNLFVGASCNTGFGDIKYGAKLSIE